MRKHVFRYSFFLTLLSQSCVVYNQNSVPLIQAAGQGKVKMIAPSGKIYKFTNIELYDSAYYGMGKEYVDQYTYITPEGAKTPIDSTMNQAIYIKDVKKSKKRTVLLVVGLSIPVVYIGIGILVFIFSGF